jgi:hypothetical protein
MPRQLSQTCSSAPTHERVRQTLSCWLVRTPVLCLSGRRRSITVVLSLSVSSRFALVRCHYTSPAGLLCAPVLCLSGRRQSLASVLSLSLSPQLNPTPASASRSCRQLRLPTKKSIFRNFNQFFDDGAACRPRRDHRATYSSSVNFFPNFKPLHSALGARIAEKSRKKLKSLILLWNQFRYLCYNAARKSLLRPDGRLAPPTRPE